MNVTSDEILRIRKDGFYWVKMKSGDWEIGYFQSYVGVLGRPLLSWMLAGDGDTYRDEHFIEIDERRIVRHV